MSPFHPIRPSGGAASGSGSRRPGNGSFRTTRTGPPATLRTFRLGAKLSNAQNFRDRDVPPYIGLLLTAVLTSTTANASNHANREETSDNIAKAFVAIIRRNGEVNIQDLSSTFNLPGLDRELIWQGPFGGYQVPIFTGYYDPPDSTFGIRKITITWDMSPLVRPHGQPAILQRLVVFLKSGYCPTEAEMTAATGVQMREMMLPGFDGGPPSRSKFFPMLSDKGSPMTINYGDYTLSASYVRDR
jgi:hypothetical protein